MPGFCFESRLSSSLVGHDLKELRGARIFRSRQHDIGRPFLDNRPIGQKHRSVRDLPREAGSDGLEIIIAQAILHREPTDDI